MDRKILLPVGLDAEERLKAAEALLLKYARRNPAGAMAWVEDVYPDERGWVDQPGNTDERGRVYYARIHTRKRGHLDKQS